MDYIIYIPLTSRTSSLSNAKIANKKKENNVTLKPVTAVEENEHMFRLNTFLILMLYRTLQMKIWRCKLRSWKENTTQRLIPWSSTVQRANYRSLHCNHCIERILMCRIMQLPPILMMIRHQEQVFEQYIRSITNSTVVSIIINLIAETAHMIKIKTICLASDPTWIKGNS